MPSYSVDNEIEMIYGRTRKEMEKDVDNIEKKIKKSINDEYDLMN